VGQTLAQADALHNTLEARGFETLYDDRDLRPGEKFADADLIGIPVRVVVSDKTVASDQLEVTLRSTGEVKMQTEEELCEELTA